MCITFATHLNESLRLHVAVVKFMTRASQVRCFRARLSLESKVRHIFGQNVLLEYWVGEFEMLTSEQARALVGSAGESDKWRPLFLQIEAAARLGYSSLGCMDISLPVSYAPAELKAVVTALGYRWEDGRDGYFTISWR